MAHDQSPAYVRPPVRQAGFTLYFEPLEFDLPLIMSLQSGWEDRYPATRQTIPSPRRGELPRVDILKARWPMPAIEQSTENFNPVLSYQYDQLSLKWTFEEDDDIYPGYSKISSDLFDRFQEFVSGVEASSGESVRVQAAQCYYSNFLEGIDTFDWICGFLSGWQSQSGADRKQMGLDHVGFRARRRDRNSSLDTRRSSWVQLDEGNEQEAELVIWCTSQFESGDDSKELDPAESARTLLDDAHEFAIHSFESSFSDEIKKTWEPR
ncbi:hypothetical protein [Nocardia gipuzkoensis]|uniref:hypothetical protein n=1 Tax=Nocardia gipuzkoensis TaxID=2749991 RepID=UPI003EE40F32